MMLNTDDVTIQLERIRALAIIGSCGGDVGVVSDHFTALLATIVEMAEAAQVAVDALEYSEPAQTQVSQ